MDEFKEGDVVYLKSGGPALTISLFNDERREYAHCYWFDADLKKMEHIFNLVTLTKTKPSI